MRNLKLKIIEFLYDHKLLNVHKRCWAEIVLWSLDYRSSYKHDVGYKKNCGYCGCCEPKK